MADKKKSQSKPKPVMLVARDYIVTGDGVKYKLDAELPPDVAAALDPSFMKKKEA